MVSVKLSTVLQSNVDIFAPKLENLDYITFQIIILPEIWIDKNETNIYKQHGYAYFKFNPFQR